MNESCLLCHDTQLQILDHISVEDLDRLWRRRLGGSVRQEFPGIDRLAFCRCTCCGLAFFTPARAGSAAFYAQLPGALRLYYLDEKPEYAFARGLIGASDSVLEIGAGKGAFAKDLNCCQYLGLEFSDSAIALAAERRVRVIKEPVEEHARRHTGGYDVVCAFQVLEHVADVHGFVAAGVACLRPGGRLIYSVPAEDSYLALLPNAALNLPPHHVSRWPHQALRKLADIFHLELVALEHEPLCGTNREVLAGIRARDYAQVVAAQAINRCLGRASRLVDLSPAQRLIDLLAVWAGRFFALGLHDSRLFPAGHSVTCVYRKR